MLFWLGDFRYPVFQISVHSSASSNLLMIPSSVFFTLVIIFFSYDWFFLIFSVCWPFHWLLSNCCLFCDIYVIFVSLSSSCYFLKQSQLRSNLIKKYWILNSTVFYPIIQRGAYQWWNVEEEQLKQKEKTGRRREIRIGIPTACADLLDLLWGTAG